MPDDASDASAPRDRSALLSPDTQHARESALAALLARVSADPGTALPPEIGAFLSEREADSLLEGVLIGLVLDARARAAGRKPTLDVVARVLPAVTFWETDLRNAAADVLRRYGRSPREAFGEVVDAFSLEDRGKVEEHYFYQVMGKLTEKMLPEDGKWWEEAKTWAEARAHGAVAESSPTEPGTDERGIHDPPGDGMP